MERILLFLLLLLASCNMQNKDQTSTVPPKNIPEQNSKIEDSLMSEKELIVSLTGSGYKKAELLLGYYDHLGTSSSSYLACPLYKNKVRNSKGEIANVVLVVRFIDMFDWNTATITKVYILPEGGRCRCGLTPLKVKNGRLD